MDYRAPRLAHRHALGLFALPLLLSVAERAVCAETPRVQFDMAPVAVCRDITDEAFVELHPNERLLEARFEVSTLLVAGHEDDLDEFVFRFTSPGKQLRIADYSPKSTLASEYAGTINVEKKNEATKSAGVSVSGVLDHLVKVGGSGDIGSKDQLALKYELHSPKEPVTSSGTVARGTGAYFKFRPSRQTSLEGSRTFQFVLRAPADWRGDYLQVHCEAHGRRRGVMRTFDEPFRAGARDFFVALYLAGDAESKTRAEQMARAESDLQAALAAYRDQLHQSQHQPFWRQITVAWASRETPSAATLNQLERVLFSHSPFDPRVLPKDLPESLQHALVEYLAARTTVRVAGRAPRPASS